MSLLWAGSISLDSTFKSALSLFTHETVHTVLSFLTFKLWFFKGKTSKSKVISVQPVLKALSSCWLSNLLYPKTFSFNYIFEGIE
jgi:hypothetical protein